LFHISGRKSKTTKGDQTTGKRKILFISAFSAPFIEDDIRILETRYDVIKQIGSGPGAFFKIFLKIFAADKVFCWFASSYSFAGVFLARLLGIHAYVVAAGVDASKNEEIGYGIWLNPFKARLVRYVFRKATTVLAVDTSIRDSIVRLAGYNGDNIVCLPTGYDTEFWKPLGPKDKIVLTVATANDPLTWKVKGIDILLETARRLPAVSFVIVGVSLEFAKQYQPTINVKFIGKITRNEVLPYYQRAYVYCQPSRSEGLSNALCEAMACGCIPVATQVGGNPTAVGDTGLLVPTGDAVKLAIAINQALEMDVSFSTLSRARIVALFPGQKRETDLLNILNEGAL
jgi:glycosyltransferase involved in cell wall biosynthesis